MVHKLWARTYGWSKGQKFKLDAEKFCLESVWSHFEVGVQFSESKIIYISTYLCKLNYVSGIIPGFCLIIYHIIWSILHRSYDIIFRTNLWVIQSLGQLCGHLRKISLVNLIDYIVIYTDFIDIYFFVFLPFRSSYFWFLFYQNLLIA